MQAVDQKHIVITNWSGLSIIAIPAVIRLVSSWDDLLPLNISMTLSVPKSVLFLQTVYDLYSDIARNIIFERGSKIWKWNT